MQIDNDFHDVYNKKGISVDISPGLWSRLTNTKLTDFEKPTAAATSHTQPNKIKLKTKKRFERIKQQQQQNTDWPGHDSPPLLILGFGSHEPFCGVRVCECASNQ